MQCLLKMRGKAPSFARACRSDTLGSVTKITTNNSSDPGHFPPVATYSKEELKGLKAQVCGRGDVYH